VITVVILAFSLAVFIGLAGQYVDRRHFTRWGLVASLGLAGSNSLRLYVSKTDKHEAIGWEILYGSLVLVGVFMAGYYGSLVWASHQPDQDNPPIDSEGI
jgi:hypothetical protein